MPDRVRAALLAVFVLAGLIVIGLALRPASELPPIAPPSSWPAAPTATTPAPPP